MAAVSCFRVRLSDQSIALCDTDRLHHSNCERVSVRFSCYWLLTSITKVFHIAKTGRVCLMCEPASHASHAIHASQGASHASHRFNVKNNQIMEIII